MRSCQLLSFCFLFLPTAFLLAQTDSLSIVHSQYQTEYDELIARTFSKSKAERIADSSSYEDYERMIEISQELADTMKWIMVLDYKFEWVLAARNTEEINSIFFQARELASKHGYVLRNHFYSEYNSYRYNIVNEEILYLTDTLGNIPFDSILQASFQSRFQLNHNPRNGLDSNHVYWVKIRLRGDGQHAGRHLLMPSTQDQHWQKADFYFPDRLGAWTINFGGATIPIKDRITPDWRDLFPVEIQPMDDFYVYFRLAGFKKKAAPNNLNFRHISGSFLDSQRPRMLIRVYAFIAILAFQFFFFLLWYSVTKEQTFVPYLVYIFGILMITILSIHLKFWFPNPNWDNDGFLSGILVFFSWISGLGLLRFVQIYLNSNKLIPKWHKALLVFKYGYSISAVLLATMLFLKLHPNLTFGNTYNRIISFNVDFFIFLLAVGLSLITLVGIASWRKGYQPAKYYLLAIVCLLMSLGLMSLVPLTQVFNNVSFNEAMSTVQAGIVLQLCFFALGIGNKRRTLEKEKMKAQNQLLEEQQKVNSAFGRFVPHKFLEAIGRDSVLDIKLGDGVEKEVTVFFSDIRGYTRLAEQMQPQENFRFLNGYLGRLGPIISDHNGFVNQYYGDGIMAIFMQQPEDALKAALAIQIRLQAYNEERKQKGRIPIKIGIGMHTGPLIMGVIGDTLRMEAGVVSDTVNTAARMEGLTKHFGASVLVSETVFDQIPENDSYAYRYLGKVQVKGKQEPLRIYDFFGSDIKAIQSKKAQTKSHFDQGVIAYYDRDFAAACHAFNEVLKVFPNDQSSNYFMQKAQDYLVNGVAADWTGVEEMLTK